MKIDQNSRAKVNELWLDKPPPPKKKKKIISHILYGLQSYEYDTGIALIYYA